MKNPILITLLLLFSVGSNAQVNWAEDAAQVFYDNCTSCHNPNGVGPMSLLTYSDAAAYSSSIYSNVLGDVMPPWSADTAYQHFSQERVLTEAERNIILNWVNDEALEGDPALAPPPPVYNGEQTLPGIPDLVITAPNYMSKATEWADDYVCFAIPTGLVQDRKVRAIEVIPGNLATVHHCLVYSDASGTAVTDTVGSDCGGPANGSLMVAYIPGSTSAIFPNTADFSAGMVLEAGSDIVLAMHYPEGSFGEWDQTKVVFYFYDEPVNNFREIFANPIISDWTFTIDANTVDSVEVTFDQVTEDVTVLSVFPHMHLLGKSIGSYGVTPSDDTIPFIRIPQWDFDWQDFYWFEYMKHLPAGSQIKGKGVFDNTSNNIYNPNDPPQDVSAGLNTTDEMFLIYYHYMAYLSGDENISMDSLVDIFLSQPEYGIDASDLNAFPNPFSDRTSINFTLENTSVVSLYIYDIHGRQVSRLLQQKQVSGAQSIEWNGTNSLGVRVSPGMYFYSILIDGQERSGKIVLR